MKILVAFAVLLSILFAAIFAMVPAQDRPIRYKDKIPYAESRHLQLVREAESITADTLVLLGDSHIEFMPVHDWDKNNVNLGIQGDSTYAVLDRIKDYEKIFDANTVVIAVGINDLVMEYSAKETLASLLQLIERFPQSTSVYVSQLLPLSEAEGWSYINKISIKYNQMLTDEVRELPNVSVVPEPFTIRNGEFDLLEIDHQGDGIHLSGSGYALWLESIDNAIRGGLSAK
ncbi:GDSL-type esterase/lipase family protein [Reinekea sp. G2M2-21]|uniref:GDSL-type esterase/lipase family protein n=1 Tax=Reinekea sp. G2M2-21 TaxID=2788942 RepID=UPI0018AB58FE|nr:GDSL-type esterase/lipase family protein [Reinekea sp. G2M2-21]